MEKTNLIFNSRVLKLLDMDGLSNFINQFQFSLNAFGHQYGDPLNSSCGNRILGDFELIYFIKGKGSIMYGDKKFLCEMGDLVLIPPFICHSIQSDKDDPHDNYWLHFDISPFYLQQEFISEFVKTGGYVCKIGIQTSLIVLIKQLEKEQYKKQEGQLINYNALMLLYIVEIFRLKRGNAKSYQANIFPLREKTLVDQCISWVEKNIDKPISIKILSETMHVSESTLYKAFVKITMLSPQTFLLHYRLKVAEQMMKLTDLTFHAISKEVGFANYSYFSLQFKKMYKCSPKEYLKQNLFL